jgi:hypothetical protein
MFRVGEVEGRIHGHRRSQVSSNSLSPWRPHAHVTATALHVPAPLTHSLALFPWRPHPHVSARHCRKSRRQRLIACLPASAQSARTPPAGPHLLPDSLPLSSDSPVPRPFPLQPAKPLGTVPVAPAAPAPRAPPAPRATPAPRAAAPAMGEKRRFSPADKVGHVPAAPSDNVVILLLSLSLYPRSATCPPPPVSRPPPTQKKNVVPSLLVCESAQRLLTSAAAAICLVVRLALLRTLRDSSLTPPPPQEGKGLPVATEEYNFPGMQVRVRRGDACSLPGWAVKGALRGCLLPARLGCKGRAAGRRSTGPRRSAPDSPACVYMTYELCRRDESGG